VPDAIPETEPSAGYFEGRTHVLQVRVYYEDTDAAGMVYYANYLRYMERGRSDMLRLAGVTHGSLDADDDDPLARTLFVVRRCEVEYLRQARLNDGLMVRTTLANVGGASMTMEQVVCRDGVNLVDATVRVGCVTGDGRPKRIPGRTREALQSITKDNEENLRNAS
jgi:acyl-CoA thioester hydrolase